MMGEGGGGGGGLLINEGSLTPLETMMTSEWFTEKKWY